jgi:hypothetical protein
MRGWLAATGIIVLALVCLFPMWSADYPVDDGKGGNGFGNQKASAGTWTGGTIPDERSFIGWAQIYWETGHLWLPESNANVPAGFPGGPPNGQHPPGQGPQPGQGPPPGGKPPPTLMPSVSPEESDVTTQAAPNGKYDVPQVSARITVDGERGFANHWPAAQSLYLVPFYLTNTTLVATLLPLGGALYAVWWLANRWMGKWAGLAAAGSLAVSGLVVMGAYSRFMADLPSACFIAIGMALVVNVADRANTPQDNRQRLVTFALAAAAGAALGWAVLIRLTAVLALPGPAMFLAARLVQRRKVPGHTKQILLAALPAIAVLAVFGLWLMWYNSSLFGSITASGYGDRGSAGRSFDATTDDAHHFFTVVAPRLFAMAPILAAALPALVGIRRHLDKALLLSGWGVPVFVFYAQLGWVGRVGWEDMRYFLPAVPMAAVAFGLAAKNALEDKQVRWMLAGAALFLLVAALWSGSLGIDFQTARLSGGQRGPPQSTVPEGLDLVAWIGVFVAWVALAWGHVVKSRAAARPATATSPAAAPGAALRPREQDVPGPAARVPLSPPPSSSPGSSRAPQVARPSSPAPGPLRPPSAGPQGSGPNASSTTRAPMQPSRPPPPRV